MGAPLHCGTWASLGNGSSCGSQALGMRALVVVVCGISSCSLHVLEHKVQLPQGTRDPPRLGIKPVSLALAGEFLTGPPGKSQGRLVFNISLMNSFLLIMTCDPGHLTQDIVFSFKSNHLN